MPLSKAGKKIKAKLEKQYGEKKGEGIFYAMENKGEIPGMNKMKGYAKGGDTKTTKSRKRRSESDSQDDLARTVQRTRERASERESRPARQEARYREEQQARRERGGLSRLAMFPESVRRMQARATDRLIRPYEAEDIARLRAEADEKERQLTDSLSRGMAKGGSVKKKTKGYAKGGMVKSTGKMNTGIRKCGE